MTIQKAKAALFLAGWRVYETGGVFRLITPQGARLENVSAAGVIAYAEGLPSRQPKEE